MIRLEMKNYNVKLIVSALSPEKINKYEYLTGEEILASNQRLIIEEAKLAYYPFGKALEKQTEKQVGALMFLDTCKKKINSNKFR